ncbi:MAG TPA: prepilin-type N-terminal cleavage/methylation domain-containing protein [Actinomycetes bacterium]|nr:prepilin-type N-terminal cleavage/methylation domain-containing protein [Actinomycetes bacterium]
MDSREEAGFALPELLVSMAIVSIVMMATLSAFSTFHKNERQNRLHNESTDMARMAMERMTAQLRNLSGPNDNVPESVEKAQPFDLVFLTVDPVKPVGSLNARNIKRVRYCVGAASGGRAPLIRMEQEWQVQDKPPGFSTASCIDDGVGGWEITAVVANDVVNTTQATPVPVFTYTPAAAPLDEITGIRADLSVDVNPNERPAAVSLGSGVFLRNQNRKPVADCTAVPTGTGMQVALNGSASEDPEGFNLKSYAWKVNGTTIGGMNGVVGVWTATTPGTYTFTIEVKDQGDLGATGTCTATVVG